MIGYIKDTKIGAFIYNIFHHRGLSLIFYMVGVYLNNELIQLVAVILFAHSTMDRIFGYGLKLLDSFKNTHLGELK